MTTPDAIAVLTRALALKMQVLACAAPATADHLAAQADEQYDGYPTTGAGVNGPAGYSATSSTERSVINRDIRTDSGEPRGLGELWDLLCAARLALDHALKVCDTHGPRIGEATLRNLRCQGIDFDHDCTNIADPLRKDHRCIECGRNVDAQRQRRTVSRC